MNYEAIPISLFINMKYQTLTVQKVVESWRLEPQHVIDRLIEHFREMGIYNVPFGHERLMVRNIIFQLLHSPEIQRMVTAARNDELKRQRSRHAT